MERLGDTLPPRVEDLLVSLLFLCYYLPFEVQNKRLLADMPILNFGRFKGTWLPWGWRNANLIISIWGIQLCAATQLAGAVESPTSPPIKGRFQLWGL